MKFQIYLCVNIVSASRWKFYLYIRNGLKSKGSPSALVPLLISRALVPLLISLKHYFRCTGISKNQQFRSKTKLRSAIQVTFLYGVHLKLMVLGCIRRDRHRGTKI